MTFTLGNIVTLPPEPDMPPAVRVLLNEGDDWREFQPAIGNPRMVHAIEFSNGRIWDTVNGWRPSRRSQKLARLQILIKEYAGVSDEAALRLAQKTMNIMESEY